MNKCYLVMGIGNAIVGLGSIGFGIMHAKACKDSYEKDEEKFTARKVSIDTAILAGYSFYGANCLGTSIASFIKAFKK